MERIKDVDRKSAAENFRERGVVEITSDRLTLLKDHLFNSPTAAGGGRTIEQMVLQQGQPVTRDFDDPLFLKFPPQIYDPRLAPV